LFAKESKSRHREARVKNELQKVRNWAEASLRAGAVPDRSWPDYVRLVETIDGMLRDISIAENAPRAEQADIADSRQRHKLRAHR
jgi:hypothetical protein